MSDDLSGSGQITDVNEFRNLLVEARFCEGGHRCSPPKECCAQGCCYLFAPPTVPRTTPPPSNHVLNLFFINHWYFWCVVLAIILAFLCACSLWKRRRQLCNWDIPLQSSQSEGDSAGSCYAPPQYSRCSSFHHAPPPYTEVTSKPDLYPIVFTCNGDGVKNGASYLMVQYFRNYIVRPVGSLSATSTVDSLSSSFICPANESNTLVPPPYSRAASPEQNQNSNSSCSIPRSASHQICFSECFQFNNNNINSTSAATGIGTPFAMASNKNKTHNLMRLSESVNFSNLNQTNNILNNNNSVILSRSDQEFRYNIINTNSNNNIENVICNAITNSSIPATNSENLFNLNLNQQSTINTNNKISTNYSIESTNGICNSFNSSIDRIPQSSSLVINDDNNKNHHNLIQEASCQILFHKKYNNQNLIPNASFNISEDSPLNSEMNKKFESNRSLVNSNTDSAVSSLANLDSPASPPRATSPTAEVKELLEQINKLHINNSEFEPTFVTSSQSSTSIKLYDSNASGGCNNVMYNNKTNNINYNSKTLEMPKNNSENLNNYVIQKTKRPSTLQTKKQKFFNKTNKGLYTPILNENSSSSTSSSATTNRYGGNSCGSSSGGGGGSGSGVGGRMFIGSNSILSSAGRANKKRWISRSAPTTPGSNLPSNRLEDHSPLLNEHDEDNDQNI